RQFTHAAHQTCLAHLLRRCRTLLLDYPAHPFVTAVKAILHAALTSRDRYPAGTTPSHGLAITRAQYLERLGQLLDRTPSRHLRVRRFQGHLIVEYDAIFSFLFDPTLDATNWRAEQALRPAVVTRKMCGGGNRTRRGADSQQVLASVLRTADQRGLDATGLLVTLLTARTPSVPPMCPAGAGPAAGRPRDPRPPSTRTRVRPGSRDRARPRRQSPRPAACRRGRVDSPTRAASPRGGHAQNVWRRQPHHARRTDPADPYLVAAHRAPAGREHDRRSDDAPPIAEPRRAR